MNDISLGKNGKSGQVSANQLQQGGIKKEQIKNKKLESLFDAADINKDGILDKQEAEKLLNTLNNDDDKNTISSKEAKSYLKQENIKELKQEDLYEFLQELVQAGENIKSSNYSVNEAGKKTVYITYMDDSQEVLNPDGSKDVTTTQDGATIVRHYNKGSKTPSSETKTTETETTVTKFGADGKPVEQTIKSKGGSSVKTVTYEDGKPKSAQVKSGITTEYYSYDENGTEVVTSKTENKGIDAKERHTTYEYGENNTATENVTEPGRTIVRKLKDDKLQTEIITESDRTISTTISEDGTKTVRTELKDGTATEVVTNENGEETTTSFNADGKKLSQTVTKDGTVYEVKYDGKGNTYVIVQNSETPASIAQKFGTNSKTLLGMNKNYRDELGNEYFSVGQQIKVPGEISADDERIATGKSARAAQNDYITSGGAAREQAADKEVGERKKITWTEKKNDTFEAIARELFKQEGVENPSTLQLSKRIKNLKHDNPNLVDGQLIGKKIVAGVEQTRYDAVAKAGNERKAADAARQNEIIQKKSAADIVSQLLEATDGRNDLGKIQRLLAQINDPVEMAEVNRLLSSKYKADDLYSPIEKFIYEENNHDAVHKYNSTDYMEQRVQKWIANGTIKGQDAIDAQARLAARVIFDAGDGFGTDCDKTKKGIYMIKSPTGKKADAAAVYKKVNEIVSKHSTFYGMGSASKDLADYLDGEMWDGEVKYLNGILAQSNALQGEEKAQAVHDLVEEAVSGGGTDIEYLQQAINAIDSPEDMKEIEAKLEEYCKKKGIEPQIEGQSYLQAILYDESDTFMGISADHKEIRKFNEMLISQGAYTPEQAVNIRAEQAVLQILDGGFDNAKDALTQIKDPAVLAKMHELLQTKGYQGLDGYLSDKFKSSQTNQDLLKAELAANQLLSDDEAATVALRLIQNSDFDTRAKGIAAIRNNAQAQAVDKDLKENGSSLAKVFEKFNAEKAQYQSKAKIWDGIAQFAVFGLNNIAEHISDEYRENTDISDNLYVEADKATNIPPEKQQAYELTVKTFEEKLEQMKKDYQNALNSQGAVSGAIDKFCSIYNLGTTRDEIEARIEHDTETLRLLKLASEGKLQKIVDGKPVNVSFEEIFTERQSAVVSANGTSIEAIKKTVKTEEITFNQQKVDIVANQATLLAAMEPAKDMITSAWGELNSALASNNNTRLSTAIYASLNQISQMTGKQLSLDSFGYQLNDGVIVDKNGNPVPADKLKEIANQLKQGISDISKELFGKSIPMNADNKSVSSLLDKGYKSKMKEFKKQYRDAFGQDSPDEVIKSYVSTINAGLTIVNLGTSIGAVIAAPFTGGGSLAMFGMAAGATVVTQGVEQSTDANGWTNSEWTTTATNAAWNGVLSVAGFKVSQLAEAFALGSTPLTSQSKWLANLSKLSKPQAKAVLDKAQQVAAKLEATTGKVGAKAISAQKAKLAARFPNISAEKLDKIAVVLAGSEAAALEITSDTLQSLVQTYCMNGEFNLDSFAMDIIMSIAGNASGHAFSAYNYYIKGRQSANANLKPEAPSARGINPTIRPDDAHRADLEEGNGARTADNVITKPIDGSATPEAEVDISATKASVDKKLEDILNDSTNHNNASAEFKDAILELKSTLEFVEDAEILKYLDNLKLNVEDDLQEAIDLVNAINTFNGHYSAIKTPGSNSKVWKDNYKNMPDSQKHSFMKFLKKNDPKAYDDLIHGRDVQIESSLIEKFHSSRQQAVFRSDADAIEKTSELMKYMKQYKDSPMANRLYNLYLDKMANAGVPPEIISKCVELNNKFGTKVVFGSDIADLKKVLNYIDKELSSWKSASDSKAKIPPVFDFNNFNKDWYDKSSVLGQNVSAAYSDSNYGGSLSFAQTTEEAVKWALRHEITHANALPINSSKITKNVIDDIMPKKKVVINGKETMVPDMDRAKYVDEFKNAGVPEASIPYAYNNISEFIAVASQGNMSKYSPEFKALLVDMGMPEWMFKLDNPNAEIPAAAVRTRTDMDVHGRAAIDGVENTGKSHTIAPEAPNTSVLNNIELKYLPEYTKFPEATIEVLNEIASRIKNGGMPSQEMLSSVLADISAKTGISAFDLKRDFGRSMKVLDNDWQGLESAFNRPEASNLESGGIKRKLNIFKEERDLLSDTEIQTKQEATLKAEQEAQAKAQEQAQAKARAEAEAQARAEAQAKAEQAARAERQRILDENADKYPEVVNEENFREETTAANLIILMENYDLKMSYADFDSTQIYRKINEAGITNDADMDIAFKMIQERFHSDVIAEGARIKDIKKKYGFFSEDSVTNSDTVIAKIKEKQANGEKITEDDIDNMLYDLPDNDVRDINKMKNRIMNEPELQAYLNDNLHLDIYNNPKYGDVPKESLDDAVAMLDRLKAEVKSGNTLTLETVQKIYDSYDAVKRADNGYVSTDALYVLQDAIRNDKTLSVACKDFVEDIIQGGYPV